MPALPARSTVCLACVLLAGCGSFRGNDATSGDAGAQDGGADGSISDGASPDGWSPNGPPLSCAPGGPGMTECGPGGGGSDSCCLSLEVDGGTYYRTYDPPDLGGDAPTTSADGGPTGEADPATVSGFRLDKYLVTVGRFRRFREAVMPSDGGAGWTPPAGSGRHTHLNAGAGLSATQGGEEQGWLATDTPNVAPTDVNLTCSAGLDYSTWTPVPENNEYLPINCVNWYEAYAFCIWDGGFLPSEAEWEYAAAGGSQQRVYPWGSTPPGASFQYAIHAGPPNGTSPVAECFYPSDSTCLAGSTTNIAPVGTAAAGAGLWGQLDLAGEMAEWGLDSFDQNYSNTCSTDCADLTQPLDGRVARGGYFDDTVLVDLVPSTRVYDSPAVRAYRIGFRCARVP